MQCLSSPFENSPSISRVSNQDAWLTAHIGYAAQPAQGLCLKVLLLFLFTPGFSQVTNISAMIGKRLKR